LTRLARAYLDSHPEIIKEATETVRNVPTLRRMAQREGREARKARLGLSVNGHRVGFT
jgi:hypothetical protein